MSDARRLVAAQARLYSDAKRLFFGRLTVVFVLAAAVMATSVAWPESRVVVGGGGGLLLFLGSFVVESVEKGRRMQAAATQELLDTRVFQLEWNKLHAVRPPAILVARAAGRYAGDRDGWWPRRCSSPVPVPAA